MTEKRLLAVLGFFLALIGGILVLVAALNGSRNATIDLEFLARRAVDIILGVAAILCGVFIYKGRMSTGGLLTVIVGVVLLVVQGRIGLEAILIIIGGILGIVGAEARAT